jgi:Fe-S-cluster containining protein
MKKMKTVIQEVEIIEDIICNKCGGSCCTKFDPIENTDFYGLIEASFSTGYFSQHLPDGFIYSFSLCEKCLAELFKSFKIEPKTIGFLP